MFKVPRPSASRPPTYGKFAMDEWIMEGNKQKVFSHEFTSFQMSYYSEDQPLIRKN